MSITLILLFVLCLGGMVAGLAILLVIWQQNQEASQDSFTDWQDDLPSSEQGQRMSLELEAELLPLIRDGYKIDAIKAYRAATGASLKDAKEAVEGLERRYQ